MILHSSKYRFGLAAILAVILVGAALIVLSDETDPIALYYWQKAHEAAPAFDPNTPGLSYAFTAKSYRHSVGDNGRITTTDSVVQEYFVTGGSIDSVTTTLGKSGKFGDLDLTFPSVFEMEYHLRLFPNDTGGSLLAIEIRSDSTRADQPDGLVLIDRYRYHLRSLYLYFPAPPGYRRLTRTFRFVLVDDIVFLDSVLEVATRLGIFSTESYRFETGISNIRVWRTGDSLTTPSN